MIVCSSFKVKLNLCSTSGQFKMIPQVYYKYKRLYLFILSPEIDQ